LVAGGCAAISPHRSSLLDAAGFKGLPDDFGGAAAISPHRSSTSLCDVDGLMSEDFADILGGAAAIGPHKGSSSGFDAFSGCDFGGFATALDKNQKEKNKIKWASFKPISLVDMLSNKALRLG
jgi:hypothetical protein